MTAATSHTGGNSLGLTQEDFAILCRADAQSPALIKMIVGDDRDSSLMTLREREKRLAVHHSWEAWRLHRRLWFPTRWGLDPLSDEKESL